MQFLLLSNLSNRESILSPKSYLFVLRVTILTSISHTHFHLQKVFILSAIISFATGSSWGTFAIMLPLVIPTAVAIDAPLHVCMGAVLSGGLFGDHSSPISETTILSSTGASCSQIDHFRTQLPYALFNGAISLSAFVVAGVTGSALIILVAVAAQIAGLLIIRRMQNPS